MNNKRVLVIDDDEAILAALAMVLEDAGYDVVTSTKDGQFVDRTVRAEPPDLIILDILLSGQDGRTICRKLKSDEATRHIPVMLISAHPNAEAMSEEVGADSFVAKPFDIDSLLEQVERLLQARETDGRAR